MFPPHDPVDPSHPLYPFLAHGYHSASCGANALRIRRHDALVSHIASEARTEGRYLCDDRKGLSSSSIDGSKVDLILTSYERTVHELALDMTVSVPLLPRYVPANSLTSDAIFDLRAVEKTNKHFVGCQQLGRAFIPVVFTTLGGIGPAPSFQRLDSLFSASFARERASGGTGYETNLRRALFFQQTLHAVLSSTTAKMTADLPHPAAVAAPAPRAPTAERSESDAPSASPVTSSAVAVSSPLVVSAAPAGDAEAPPAPSADASDAISADAQP